MRFLRGRGRGSPLPEPFTSARAGGDPTDASKDCDVNNRDVTGVLRMPDFLDSPQRRECSS